MANKLPITQGSLLVAEPFMQDSYFKRSVVLITEYNEQGTVGFILNKPIDLNLNEAIADFPPYKEHVYFGGPVATDQLFYIHTLGKEIDGSLPVADGLYWNGDFDSVRELFRLGKVPPEKFRFYAGYAGWNDGQLEKEYEEKSWIVSPSIPKNLLTMNPAQLWQDILRSMGKEYAIMANFPQDPQLN